MSFSTSQTIRYGRQMIMEEIGEEGQKKLLSAKILVVGAGGLGSPVLLYLASAGVGTLGVVDYDVVELSNLQRQILFTTNDLKRSKVEVAGERLTALNPDIKIEQHHLRLDEKNVDRLFPGYDVVVDATDTFVSKFLVNDTCVRMGKPFVHGAVQKFSGQVLTWLPGHACYRCVFKEEPDEGVVPGCQQVGVLGTVVGLIGSIQASEAIKLVLGKGTLLLDRMFIADVWTMKNRIVSVTRDMLCKACAGEWT